MITCLTHACCSTVQNFGSLGSISAGETVLDPMAAAEEQMRSEEDKKRKAIRFGQGSNLDPVRFCSDFRVSSQFFVDL